MRLTILLTAAAVLAPAGTAAADSTTGNGDNTFIGTGGPVQLAISAHGTGTAVRGQVESSGTVVEVFIQDNGPPGHGVPDANATREPEFPPFGQLVAGNCDDPSLQPEWNPIDTGNYVVRAG
jgi:hypothetical protein